MARRYCIDVRVSSLGHHASGKASPVIEVPTNATTGASITHHRFRPKPGQCADFAALWVIYGDFARGKACRDWAMSACSTGCTGELFNRAIVKNTLSTAKASHTSTAACRWRSRLPIWAEERFGSHRARILSFSGFSGTERFVTDILGSAQNDPGQIGIGSVVAGSIFGTSSVNGPHRIWRGPSRTWKCQRQMWRAIRCCAACKKPVWHWGLPEPNPPPQPPNLFAITI